MPGSEAPAILASRGNEVREIASGMFENGERRTVSNFVSAAVKVTAVRARASEIKPRDQSA